MTQPTTRKIVNSWSLISFAKEFGPKMEVGKFTDPRDGSEFHSCVFTKGDTKTFVSFSSKMGELTPRDIAAQKDDLRVVKLDSGNYSLCKNQSSWEEVDLGL